MLPLRDVAIGGLTSMGSAGSALRGLDQDVIQDVIRRIAGGLSAAIGGDSAASQASVCCASRTHANATLRMMDLSPGDGSASA
jgi:hypothetical protein